MPKGKYFFIRSRLNDLVLDISGSSSDPGTEVVTWHKKDEDYQNQLWYEDKSSGSIRSRLNDMCLEINDDNTLVINDYDDGNDNQQWKKKGDKVSNRGNRDRVFDVASNNEDPGARICAWDDKGEDNQRWDFDHVDEPRYFYIVSKLNGKVVDISGGSDEPGSEVIMWERKDDPEANQLWYEDEDGFIRSKLNDFCMDGGGDNICMQPYEHHNNSQEWIIRRHRETICLDNDKDKVLDISQNNEDDGATICCWDDNGGDNQRWDIEYID